jgi:peptidyl-prolyl cis-trans isomerase C
MMSVSVNGTPIAEGVIAAEMQFHPSPTRELAWREAATALAIRALLCDEAARLGVRAEPEADEGEEETLIRALLARELRVPQPDEATCRRYHAANRARFRSPDVYEAAHILFPAAPDDRPARDRAKAAAEAVLMQLRDTPERFAELARAHSACASAADGGRLGQQSRGDLVPEIETFIMALEGGQICPVPVMSRYGAHVLRLDRRTAGADLPYEAVAERVARHLMTQSWQRAASQYLRLLVGRARIEGIDLPGAATPLVQ